MLWGIWRQAYQGSQPRLLGVVTAPQVSDAVRLARLRWDVASENITLTSDRTMTQYRAIATTQAEADRRKAKR